MDENITVDDIKQYISSDSKVLKKFNVNIDSNDAFKLRKIKEKLDIKEDSKFLRAVINLLYDKFIVIEDN